MDIPGLNSLSTASSVAAMEVVLHRVRASSSLTTPQLWHCLPGGSITRGGATETSPYVVTVTARWQWWWTSATQLWGATQSMIANLHAGETSLMPPRQFGEILVFLVKNGVN
ncbi:hypothetical protein PanWU01x14_277150 [Parasponia andersonii]|uniref:Uncharacterized protein n=1 Tax=Parasponia andersonii TaxID=3476 RepID=A0A2P5B2Q1_PARAD|nr:hypothetical protein PanWU01x14_277150 [Parasponia andersonii]